MREWILAAVLLVGCGGPAADECLSGEVWTGGNSGSPNMIPGQACIACHASGEGPSYVIAGTVYDGVDEAEDCYGVEGALVEVTDADGTVFSATSNAAGNFFVRASEADVVFPITAKVSLGDQVNEMGSAQSTGDCNSCHTEVGDGGAPGRIYLPAP